MNNIKKEKVSNFGVARYIAENKGNEITEDKLVEIAKAMNLKPKVLIKNYNTVVKIRKIFDGLNAL